jgi:hypothetical protein
MLGVVQTVYANATKQQITLSTNSNTPGQNFIAISVFESGSTSSTTGVLASVPLADIDLAAEARAALPDADMVVSPYYAQNSYGPFGYAAGRGRAGDICVYAWQKIAPSLSPGGSVRRGPIDVRLQLCDSGKTEQALLKVMYELRIVAPVHDPLRAPINIGRIGTPIMPTGAEGFANTVKPVARPTRRAVTATPAPAVVEKATIPTPDPGMPIVPGPGAINGAAPALQSSTGTTAPIVPPPPACAKAGAGTAACE